MHGQQHLANLKQTDLFFMHEAMWLQTCQQESDHCIVLIRHCHDLLLHNH